MAVPCPSWLSEMPLTFTNVFLSPWLSTNLISFDQLVDDNCAVHFSSAGCVVQDHVTGEPIARGPKLGR